MGTKPQYRPTQLPTKLIQIRRAFRLSQSEMLQRLSMDHTVSLARISEYESGTRTPSLLILMAYARAARVPLEILIDDEVVLPNRLPSTFNLARYKRNQCAHTPILAAARKESKRMSCKVNSRP